MSSQQPGKPVSLPMTLAKAKVIPPHQRATKAKEKVKEREKGKPNTHGTMTRKKCAASQGGTMTRMTMTTLVVERGQANGQKTLPIGTLPIGPLIGKIAPTRVVAEKATPNTPLGFCANVAWFFCSGSCFNMTTGPRRAMSTSGLTSMMIWLQWIPSIGSCQPPTLQPHQPSDDGFFFPNLISTLWLPVGGPSIMEPSGVPRGNPHQPHHSTQQLLFDFCHAPVRRVLSAAKLQPGCLTQSHTAIFPPTV